LELLNKNVSGFLGTGKVDEHRYFSYIFTLYVLPCSICPCTVYFSYPRFSLLSATEEHK